MLEYIVTNPEYKTVKDVALKHFEISNRLLGKLKKEQRIFVNDNKVYVTEKIKINDIVKLDIIFEETSENIVPTKMNLNIIFEDEYLLIIDKPYGVPVHPSILHFEDSLSNGVQYYFQTKKIKRKIRPINRLDKDTSGIVIFAKNEYIQESLIKQMKNKTFEKEYYAILTGHLENSNGTICAPIGRKENSIIERTVSPTGDISITHYELIKNIDIENNKLSLVKFKLETGRTHQIRVHSQYIKHPILGDFLYGKTSNYINRQALHAYKVKFIHPISKEILTFETDLPNDMKKIITNK